MFRLSNLKNLIICTEIFPTDKLNSQIVRWRRKPRWLPVAKSKLFRVPPRTVTPEDERLELMRLYNNYHTQMKAIRSFLHNEYNIKSVIDDTEEQEKLFIADFTLCSELNDIWNERKRVEREAFHKNELEKSKDLAYERLDARLLSKENLILKADEMVKKEKEAAKTFITPELLDAAIEQAIMNPIDYNFSVDLKGNIYHGRTTKPGTEQKNVEAHKN